MVVRSLLTLLGYKSDTKQLNTYKNAINGIIKVTKLAAVATIALGTAAFKTAGDMEQVEIAFETMLGSAEKADKLIKEITEFAATTPFELKGLVNSSKQLLAFGIESDDIIKKMTVLGDISAGVGREKLPTLVRAFGKIRTKGKATMEELNMILEAGVPILDELSKNLGVTQEELFKMISAGKVGFKDVDQALTGLATGTGKFAGLMQKQSKSFLGIISNIGDFLYNLTADIGKDLLPIGKEVAKVFLEFLETNRGFIKSGVVKFFKAIIFAIVFIVRLIQRLFGLFGGFGKVNKLLSDLLSFLGEIAKMLLQIIVAAVSELFGAINELADAFGGWGKIASFVGVVLKGYIGFLGKIIGFIIKMVSLVIKFYAILVRFFRFLFNMGKKVIEFFAPFFDKIKVWFTDLFNSIKETVGTAFEKVLNFFVSLGKTLNKLWNKFISFWKDVWNIVSEFFVGIWDGFIEKVTEVWDKTKEIIIGVWESITNKIKELWQGAVEFVQNLWQGILDFIEGIKKVATGVKEFFGGLFSGGKNKNTKAPPVGSVPANSINNGVNNNMSIKEVNIAIPPGTPTEQKAFIERNVDAAIKKSFDSYLREGLINNPAGAY